MISFSTMTGFEDHPNRAVFVARFPVGYLTLSFVWSCIGVIPPQTKSRKNAYYLFELANRLAKRRLSNKFSGQILGI